MRVHLGLWRIAESVGKLTHWADHDGRRTEAGLKKRLFDVAIEQPGRID